MYRLSIVALTLLLSTAAVAQERHGGGGEHWDSRGGNGNRMGHSYEGRYGNWGRSAWDHRGSGDAFGGAVIGGIFGGFLGSVFNPPPPPVVIVPAPAPVQIQEVPEITCEQKYRSFNPATGTYMGFDGVPHAAVGCQ